MDFTINYRDSRTLGARIHCEGCSGHGYQRISAVGIHKQMSLLSCGLHNNAAAIHVNRRALSVLGDRELRTIVDFDGRAIAEAHDGMRVFRGANRIAPADLLADTQRTNL